MEGNNILKNSQIIILGLCISLATILSSVIISQGIIKVKKFSSEVVEVTGSAERKIMSDSVIWKASFSRRDLDLKAAYTLLREDFAKVYQYLLKKGLTEKEIAVSQVKIKVIYRKNEKGNDTNTIEGYLVTQGLEIESQDVQKVANISRQSSELIDQGIEFISDSPDYFYTKLDTLKAELLAEATQNAKMRAEKMAAATKNRIGFMRSARSGVFQITPVNSTEVSDWGVNDTTSQEKKVTAVVHIDFSITA